MSQQQSLHALSMPPVDTTFPSTVPVAGEASYGIPVSKPATNAWMSNIMQDFCIGSFDYEVTSSLTTPIYSTRIYPFRTNAQLRLPWFHWYVSQFQSWSSSFDLVLQPIKHSAHRGAIGVICTHEVPSNESLTNGFLPMKIFDISGDDESEYVYPIPNIYAFSTKTTYDDARNLTDIDDFLLPKYAYALTNLTVMAQVPLSSSSLLPPLITFKVLLRPKGDLKVSHPVLPSTSRLAEGRITKFWNNV